MLLLVLCFQVTGNMKMIKDLHSPFSFLEKMRHGRYITSRTLRHGRYISYITDGTSLALHC